MLDKLQYISQGETSQEQIENISHTLAAGCKWVQLRFKNAPKEEFFWVAQKVKELCDSYKAMLTINDHVNIAQAIDADGVHLGLQDMSIAQARDILGYEKIIGGTANTLEDVLSRVREECNYIGLGPFRFTHTKKKLSPILGAEGIKQIMQELTLLSIEMPVYAIGGITLKDVVKIMDTGVAGVAVSGEITNHPNKKELLENFNQLLNGQINYS